MNDDMLASINMTFNQPDWPPPIPQPHQTSHFRETILLFCSIGGAVLTLVALLVFVLFFHRFKRLQSSPNHASSVKLQRFRYDELKAATNCFSNDRKLGKGGFGTVYKGILRNGQAVAVKVLDETSLQGECEFQNELYVIGNMSSPHIVGLKGFCSDGKKRLLVSEYMQKGSLQEALFGNGFITNLDWNKRFEIMLDIAKGLSFLHTKCEPAIIHGDIKPSNILLDSNFSARIADFGLAKLKMDLAGPGLRSEDVEGQMMEQGKIKAVRKVIQEEIRLKNDTKQAKPEEGNRDDVCIVFNSHALTVHTPSELATSQCSERVDPSCNDFEQEMHSFDFHQDVQSFEFQKQALSLADDRFLEEPVESQECSLSKEIEKFSNSTPVLAETCKDQEQLHRLEVQSISRPDNLEPGTELENRSTGKSKEHELDLNENTCQLDGYFTKMSLDGEKEVEFPWVKSKDCKRASFGRDWWWRQESSGELSVKEYVMEWIGNDHDSRGGKLRGSWSWREDNSSTEGANQWEETVRGQSGRSEWLVNLNDEFHCEQPKNEKRGKTESRDYWWREENFSQMDKSSNLEWWWRWRDDEASECGNNSTRSNNNKNNNNDKRVRKHELCESKKQKGSERKQGRSLSSSTDYLSGDLSRAVSSTPSTRGTICYVAPEYGGGILSEKTDVYSFGVLLLVIVSGRRPLQVMDSPLSEMERGNLISWARRLAQSGDLLELVAATLSDYNKDQATLCITVALLCLQRLPAQRPNMNEVVKILSGEVEVPSLPIQLSPSPSSGGLCRSHGGASFDHLSLDSPLASS